MKKIIVLLIIAFTSCERKMTNDEIIRECNKCISAGYKCEYIFTIYGRVEDIICYREEK